MIRAGHDFLAHLSTGDWSVIISDNMGVTLPSRALVIPPIKVITREYLDTCIHEAIHASMGIENMCETQVASLARDITEVLWKRGYRLEHKRKKKRQTRG